MKDKFAKASAKLKELFGANQDVKISMEQMIKDMFGQRTSALPLVSYQPRPSAEFDPYSQFSPST